MRTIIVLVTALMLTACGDAPKKAEALEKITWQVAGDESARPASLAFNAKEKRVSGFAGCNRFSGSYTLDHNQIGFGPMMSTKMACADAERNNAEQEFLDALSRVDSFMHVEDTLVLYDEHAVQLVRFTASSPMRDAQDAQ